MASAGKIVVKKRSLWRRRRGESEAPRGRRRGRVSAGVIEGVGRGGGLGGSPAPRAAGREDQRPGAVALVHLGVRVEPVDGIIIRAREVDAGAGHAQEARAGRPRTAKDLLGASGERCPAAVVDERPSGWSTGRG